ncbi:hypothetical protein KCU93_g434, partial [Aureobasidium melanogenum]
MAGLQAQRRTINVLGDHMEYGPVFFSLCVNNPSTSGVQYFDGAFCCLPSFEHLKIPRLSSEAVYGVMYGRVLISNYANGTSGQLFSGKTPMEFN